MVPTADLREITMQVIFTAAEQQSTREFNRKLGRLLRDLPGAGDVASQLIESSYEPIDYQKLTRHLDSSQFTMQEDEAGNLVVWINPEATAAAMDLMLEQYSIVIEIGIALYPIARLAKRLISGFAEKCVEFGQRFQRKPDAKLGAKTMLYTMNGEPIWQEARIEGASFDGKQLLVWTESSDGPVWHLASRGETYAHVLKTAEAKFMAGAVDELDIAGRGWEFTTPKSE